MGKINDKIDNTYWVKVGLESGFDDKHTAILHLNHILSMISSLPDEVTLYRLVFLDSIEDLNKLKPGLHYVLSKRSLMNNHYDDFMYDIVSSHGQGEEPYIITVKVDKSKVDVEKTIDNNMRYPHEKEITLKNHGKGCKIVKVEKLK